MAKRMTAAAAAAANQDTAYRGYLIRFTFTGQIFIEKDKHLIAWVFSMDEARQIIDTRLQPW